MSGIEDFSPFQAGIGAHATMVQVPLGTGFMQVWRHGEAKIFDDPLGDPIITFTPEDAAMLRQLADELEAAAEEYAEYQREREEEHPGQGQSPEPKTAPEPKRPQIVAGPAATPELQNFMLK